QDRRASSCLPAGSLRNSLCPTKRLRRRVGCMRGLYYRRKNRFARILVLCNRTAYGQLPRIVSGLSKSPAYRKETVETPSQTTPRTHSATFPLPANTDKKAGEPPQFPLFAQEACSEKD